MLTEARIQNFKSIQRLQLSLGRVTVLIGENGSGKSNLLEAIALASAASQLKLDPEFLVSRGIRVAEPQFMRAAFPGSTDEIIELGLQLDREDPRVFRLRHSEEPHPGWVLLELQGQVPQPTGHRPTFGDYLRHLLFNAELESFLVYSPENSSLRTFEREGQIQPLGVKGEGLFKLLKTLSRPEHQDRWQDLRENLRLLDWFDDLRIAPNLVPYETALQISDRYLAERADELALLDQRSANEGFLFLLFYFALLVSKSTPQCFAIDNIDASLNPKLCSELLRRLVLLAKKYDKQVILTTHNPAILDGLDLHDEEQRLFVVHRNSQGHTKVRRITPPRPLGDEPPVKLSEAFLRGILGGLPQNF